MLLVSLPGERPSVPPHHRRSRRRHRVAGVGGEGVLAGLQGAGEELAALGGHDPLHPVLAAAGAIQRGEDLVAADLLAGRLRVGWAGAERLFVVVLSS